VLYGAAKRRAKKRGIPFSITRDHILHLMEIQGFRCAVTGKEFCLESKNTFVNPWSPSLDQISPGKGYTPENIRVVAAIYNYARGEYEDECLIELAKLLLNPLQEI